MHFRWNITLHVAELSQRNRATRYVSWYFVQCCRSFRGIAFHNVDNKYMTLKHVWKLDGSYET